MPRRRELRGVASGLADAFVSRNNDVDGYWALGKLYKHAQEAGAPEIRLALSDHLVEPPAPEFGKMLQRYRKLLADHLAAQGLPAEWLAHADIRVVFRDSAPSKGAFECVVTLVDDLGHAHDSRRDGVCRAHDPAREMKRSEGNPSPE